MSSAHDVALAISIPLRYNLEGFVLFNEEERDSDFNSTKVQFGAARGRDVTFLPIYFNSTKVQFGAVKLDRNYHINKGLEKRFR